MYGDDVRAFADALYHGQATRTARGPRVWSARRMGPRPQVRSRLATCCHAGSVARPAAARLQLLLPAWTRPCASGVRPWRLCGRRKSLTLEEGACCVRCVRASRKVHVRKMIVECVCGSTACDVRRAQVTVRRIPAH